MLGCAVGVLDIDRRCSAHVAEWTYARERVGGGGLIRCGVEEGGLESCCADAVPPQYRYRVISLGCLCGTIDKGGREGCVGGQ